MLNERDYCLTAVMLVTIQVINMWYSSSEKFHIKHFWCLLLLWKLITKFFYLKIVIIKILWRKTFQDYCTLNELFDTV